jgi:presenilin-like A22 family membrane protease
MRYRKPWRLPPVFWSLLILLLAQIFALAVISREDPYLATKNLALPPSPPAVVVIWPQNVTAPSGEVIQVQPYSSFGPILIYFLVAVIAIGSVLFLIPVSKLMLVLRMVFTLLFAWGTFIMLVFWCPFWLTLTLAAAIGIAWFFIRRVWLHDLAMLISMAALGAVFGRLISPWTTMLLVAAIAIYDFLAVRFGYMVWMTEKLSESDNLPAFIIPHSLSGWGADFGRNQVKKLIETAPSERTESILGGGDIGFAVLITCSVYVSRSLSGALIMAIFTLLGLASAYLIQAIFLKGKAMPALPPIAVFSIIGLLITAGLPSF